MMVASSSPGRTGSPWSGAVLAMISSHRGQLFFASLRRERMADARQAGGTPSSMRSQPSSLPTNSSLDSLCSRIWRIVPVASVG